MGFKFYSIVAAVLFLLGAVAYFVLKWKKMEKTIKTQKEDLDSAKETIETLTEENNNLIRAVRAFEELEGCLGDLERKYKEKRTEYENMVASGDNGNVADALNKLRD